MFTFILSTILKYKTNNNCFSNNFLFFNRVHALSVIRNTVCFNND